MVAKAKLTIVDTGPCQPGKRVWPLWVTRPNMKLAVLQGAWDLKKLSCSEKNNQLA